MNIAIIGGAGFIGTNLYFYLKNKKISCKIIDNFKVKNNLKFFKKKDFIKCDILNTNDLKKKLKNFQIVINLAGQTGVIESNIKPLNSIKKNIIGFLNIIEACKANNINRILNASTGGAIYGNSSKISKENDISRPLSIYGLTKDFNEKMSGMISGKINIVHLRFSNVYGPFSIHKKSLIHNAIKSKILNKELAINGDGFSKRDFIYVNDLCKIIYKLRYASCGTYNVASGKSYNIKNIINNLEKLNFCPEIVFKSRNKSEVKIVKISNTKLNNKLKINKKFFTSIYDGLSNSIIWYKHNF
jgi:UDP-glucose 4-epimerase